MEAPFFIGISSAPRPTRKHFEWLSAPFGTLGQFFPPAMPAGLPLDLINRFNQAVAAQNFTEVIAIGQAAAQQGFDRFGTDLINAAIDAGGRPVAGSCQTLPQAEIPVILAEAQKTFPSEPNPLGAIISMLDGSNPQFGSTPIPTAIQILTNAAQNLRTAGAPQTGDLFARRASSLTAVQSGNTTEAQRQDAIILKALCEPSPGLPTGTIPLPARIEELLQGADPRVRSLVEDAFKTQEPNSLRSIADSLGATELASELRAEAAKMESQKAVTTTTAKKSNLLPIVVTVTVIGGIALLIAFGAD